MWLDKANVFCSTLVDRIVTGYPRNEADKIWKELGYEDKLHLVEKFTKIKGLLHDMKETEQLSEIHRIADEILEEL